MSRDEHGAVAVLFALLALVLLSVAALTVDLGQAYVSRAEVQKSSDMAALAGAAGNNLPAVSVPGGCSYGPRANPGDRAVIDVARYLGTEPGNSTITPVRLTDCNVTNGEVFYGIPKKVGSSWTLIYNKYQLTLVSPTKRVDFAFAGVMGFSGTDVGGTSTVELRSPTFSALPFYSYNGCDYGPQTLQQPNNGHAAATLQLASGSETNTATLLALAPASYPASTVAGSVQPLTITGLNLSTVAEVGFFESGNGSPGPAPVTTTSFTVIAGTTLLIPDLPDQTRGVTGVQSFWYVRVRLSPGGPWSRVLNSNGSLNAPQLTIGNPPLTCGQGSSAGNFGTLKLDHPPYNSADKAGAANVALGLTSTLAVYPLAARRADGTCSSAEPATVLWPAAGTNCVDTDTGMSSNIATGGFLGLGSSSPGSGLLTKASTTRCGPGGTPAATVKGGVNINNDVLSCFFISSATRVGDIDTAGYAGPPVLSSTIYDSPRFGYVPVLSVQPGTGGSKNYQIIEFRPCFVTDQTASAGLGDLPSADNGITMSANSVQSVQVVFFNSAALPNPSFTGGTLAYTGSGPKAPLLVN